MFSLFPPLIRGPSPLTLFIVQVFTGQVCDCFEFVSVPNGIGHSRTEATVAESLRLQMITRCGSDFCDSTVLKVQTVRTKLRGILSTAPHTVCGAHSVYINLILPSDFNRATKVDFIFLLIKSEPIAFRCATVRKWSNGERPSRAITMSIEEHPFEQTFRSLERLPTSSPISSGRLERSEGI